MEEGIGPAPTERFTDRVADYVQGRPRYPAALFDAIFEISGIKGGDCVVDIGAGTGISSEPMLRRGMCVVAVEPNAAMRAACAARLGHWPDLSVVSGAAEETGLAAGSADLVLAAQAFHWFDAARTRQEWRRILRSGGWVALVWNARRAGGTPFAAGYEALLERFGRDYRTIGHRGIGPERLAELFGGPFVTRSFPNAQELDREGLRARLLSSSYVPRSGGPGHQEMLAELERLFGTSARDGRVRLDYDCELHCGQLAG